MPSHEWFARLEIPSLLDASIRRRSLHGPAPKRSSSARQARGGSELIVRSSQGIRDLELQDIVRVDFVRAIGIGPDESPALLLGGVIERVRRVGMVPCRTGVVLLNLGLNKALGVLEVAVDALDRCLDAVFLREVSTCLEERRGGG